MGDGDMGVASVGDMGGAMLGDKGRRGERLPEATDWLEAVLDLRGQLRRSLSWSSASWASSSGAQCCFERCSCVPCTMISFSSSLFFLDQRPRPCTALTRMVAGRLTRKKPCL